MDFKGQYLTYEEYIFLGGTLDLMPFNKLEFEARKKIDQRTYGRLKQINKQIQEVKMCVFELINTLIIYEKDRNRDKSISNENIDGYSVTYKEENIETDKIKNNEIKSIIEKWLDECKLQDGTPYLYRG